MPPKMAKGQHAPLKVTEKARHRILAGLGWDPAYRARVIDKMGAALSGKRTYHDLDLSCFIYDANNSFIECVSPDPASTADSSGKIYHSGDNLEGIGQGDDESISVELKDLPAAIHHVVFVVKVQSGQSFTDIEAPLARLAGGFSNQNFLNVLIDGQQIKDGDIYVFCHIYKKGERWQVHYVDEYLSSAKNEAWRLQLTEFLVTK